jgi:hypothetical protein
MFFGVGELPTLPSRCQRAGLEVGFLLIFVHDVGAFSHVDGGWESRHSCQVGRIFFGPHGAL